MDLFRFIFWELTKAVALAFTGLLAAKAVAGLASNGEVKRRIRILRGTLFVLTIALVALGARIVGYDVAAQVNAHRAENALGRSDLVTAYSCALQAVKLRPAVIEYWRILERTKLAGRQFKSLIEDRPAFEALSAFRPCDDVSATPSPSAARRGYEPCGKLDEEDAERFAVAYFRLGRYDEALELTHRLIRDNHFYAAPYVLEGMTYTIEQKYPEAERVYATVLQIFPTQWEAVEGLAHVYFLEGDPGRAVALLNQTMRFDFAPEALQRFQRLKEFYAQ